MISSMSGMIIATVRKLAIAIATMSACLAMIYQDAAGHEVKDLKYGVILFEFYQQKYFDTLVEYEYAREKGGIQNHGSYPELLKGGVSLSYGLDEQAKDIFTDVIAANAMEEVQNRAWYYLAKMLYLRGDITQSAATLSNIHGVMPHEIDQEYRYLAALINIKLGYFEEAAEISGNFDKKSRYAPFLRFNLGVALGKQKDYSGAINNLAKSAESADGNSDLDRLADRANMAIAYLYSEENKQEDAYNYINQVSTTGVFSNRALLGSGWTAVNNGDYQKALAPLNVLDSRSMAIPEVQEAVLLIPHVYEKLKLKGRAAEGFISAYERYNDALEQLARARETLKDADVLELFVRNLDEMLDDNDWFGTAPTVSLNSLSPFLIDLMSDHSFQSVLKDLRDLYAIRNNLTRWKQKRVDFEVMLKARSVAPGTKEREDRIKRVASLQLELQERFATLSERASLLEPDEQERVQWLLGDIQYDIESAGMIAAQLEAASGFSTTTEDYAELVDNKMKSLDTELADTNALIAKVENVMLGLVNSELGIHEERLKYYRVQSHLAKVRILDGSLADLETPRERDEHDTSDTQPVTERPEMQRQATGSDGDAA
jgi:tetratricopeptide (TPR) repeat protein